MTLNLRTTGNVFSCAEPLQWYPIHDFCRRSWPGRVMSNARDVMAAARAEIILGSPVYYAEADYSARAIRLNLNGSGEHVDFGCSGTSNRVLHWLEWTLNRTAAIEAARRLNSMAARLSGASDAERYATYAEIFGAAFCLWSTLRAAWDDSWSEDPDLHPSRLPATACQWRRLSMDCLVSSAAARLVHEAAAAGYGLPMPAGDFDSGYGRCNLSYLFDAWDASECGELQEGAAGAVRQWAYRVYAPFAGPAPEGVEFPWHCAASASHPQDAEPRFEDFDDPSVPVRGHAVRLA